MIVVNIAKAKNVAHDIRRAARAAEFAPYDDIIAKRIPGTAEQEAEAERQAIRQKYADMQAAIDGATNVKQIKIAIAGE
jgi:hypothetical protein